MGKNRKNNRDEAGRQVDGTGKHPSEKLKRDGKTKKAEPDHLQHIPFRLREIMKGKDRMKKGLQPKKPKKAVSTGEPSDGDIPVPHFRRGRRESAKAYVRRMENETRHVLFLSRNQADRRPELDADGQGKPGGRGKSEKKKEYDAFKLQRLQQRKLDRQEARMEKTMFVDDVPFGEVALAPPSLSSKPKKAQAKAQKDSGTLLLHSLLGHGPTGASKPSMARRRMMEEERERAVQAYRCLKRRKQEQQDARAANVKKLTDLQ